MYKWIIMLLLITFPTVTNAQIKRPLNFYNLTSINFFNDIDELMLIIKENDKSIQINTNNTQAYHDRAFAHCGVLNYAEALTDINKLIILDPNNSEYYFGQGYVYFALKDWNNALKSLNKALLLRPSNNQVLSINVIRGLALGNLRHYKEAIQILENVTQQTGSTGKLQKYINSYKEKMK